jgi:hypothetical protein
MWLPTWCTEATYNCLLRQFFTAVPFLPAAEKPSDVWLDGASAPLTLSADTSCCVFFLLVVLYPLPCSGGAW